MTEATIPGMYRTKQARNAEPTIPRGGLGI